MDDKKKYAPQGSFDSLIKVIEELGNIKVDYDAVDHKVDLEAMRRHEAFLASQEIQQQRLENRRLHIEDIHRSGRVNAQWTFDNLVKDAQNQNAFASAIGFCSSLDIAHKPFLYFVQGGAGAGKSALLHAIANRLLTLTSKREVLIVGYEDFKRSRLFTNKESAEVSVEKQQNWERYCSVDVLFLDDLCGNNDGLTLYDQKILTELLRIRYVKGLSMVISTPVQFKFIHQAIGDSCYESIKEYEVISAILYGNSRRTPLFVEGVPIP
ncbi:MAG: DnaA/Hda family protein [Succinatimonas sp.]|nr:DnaA/Hda family protein [Succinatimonas sp.]